ncbi:hypothetical protein LJC36_02480 [Desulfovibrio sp. OttesenSCG-928-C14]|nr:hypothetical protein [Desulfovibrio sp. OttesenSCG-928-C14]
MVNMPKLAFWTWLFKGIGDSPPGVFKLFNRWLWLHLIVAIFLCALTGDDISETSKSIVLPASGILLGITFAWSGNITSLLSAKEISELAEITKGKMSEYVYSVQLSILIVFATCIFWIFSAFGLMNNFIFKALLFFISSISVRECWQTILFAQYLTITRDTISKKNNH